jgi:hypothetical protein
MQSQPPSSKVSVCRSITVALLSAGFPGCGGPAQPAASPNPLDDAPPAEPAAKLPSSPEEVETKKNKFDEEQAKIVLTRASTGAHTCVDVVAKDQPHGTGSVVITFSGVGRSTKAVIAPPFDGKPIGQCATRAFVNIIVPPFEGPDVDMTFPVNLMPDEKSSKKEAAKPKK